MGPCFTHNIHTSPRGAVEANVTRLPHCRGRCCQFEEFRTLFCRRFAVSQRTCNFFRVSIYRYDGCLCAGPRGPGPVAWVPSVSARSIPLSCRQITAVILSSMSRQVLVVHLSSIAATPVYQIQQPSCQDTALCCCWQRQFSRPAYLLLRSKPLKKWMLPSMFRKASRLQRE